MNSLKPGGVKKWRETRRQTRALVASDVTTRHKISFANPLWRHRVEDRANFQVELPIEFTLPAEFIL